MKIAIMQPYFFPYIGYWQLMNAVDEYVIFDDVNYIKRGWINRNNILFHGEKKRINLCIKDASQNKLIKDTFVADVPNDTKKILSMLKEAYRRAPYFDETFFLVEKIMSYKEKNLALFLKNEIKIIHDYLNMKSNIVVSSEIKKDNRLKAEDKIIDICRSRNADCYINAIGGKTLYHQDKFQEFGIKLNFLKTNIIRYKQFDNEFQPNLSIIDVLMFNGKDNSNKLLMEFQLES